MTKTRDELLAAVERVGIILDGMRANAAETEKLIPATPTRDMMVREMRTRADALETVLAALRSPDPEVDRLKSTMLVIANASEKSETMFGGKMSDVTRVFQHISRVARAALSSNSGGR